MEFLRYCKNHFKYKIYKILLYGIIAFILLSLTGCKEVHAIETTTQIGETDFYLPPYATFADCINGTLTRYEGVASNGFYYAPENLVTSGGDTDGMGVIFTNQELFVQGYYYSVTMLVGFSDENIYPKGTSTKVCIDHSLQTTINSWNSNTNCTTATVYTWDNVSPFAAQDGSTVYLGMISYIFTAPTTGKSFVGVMNSSARKTGYQVLGGVLVEQLADNKTYSSLSAVDMHNILNNSGLASAASIEEVQAAQEEIKQEISSVNNSLTSESENFEDSSCGVICKLGKIPGKIIDGLLDGLKSLFIPEDGYFESWFNDLKAFFEKKLGFLATPFTIVIDFINKYLELDSANDIIINIPNITVPNFEDHIIIEKTTLNWSDLLKSKESLNSLWQLYLAFVDVFLILNFIGLCDTKYNRIFGGDTSNYEYYTVEDSISYDGQTGEVISQRQNERRTTRKKV